MTFKDVRAMLAFARPGETVAEWRAEAGPSSRFPLADHRNRQLRIAAAILAPVDGRITDAQFLADLAKADPRTERDLIYGRYLAATPIAVTVGRALFAPTLPETTTDDVDPAQLDAVLAAVMQGQRLATIRRTRTAVVTEFSRAGTIAVGQDRSIRLVRPALAPRAFYHLLLADLKRRGEAMEAWIQRESLPVVLFGLRKITVDVILQELVREGRLRRSYLQGEPRILAA